MERISAVYKITNIITGECYIGSSKDVKRRWISHKCPSTWKECLTNPLYRDFQKYGLDKFDFKILKQIEPEYLKQFEQEFIERLKPTYNNYNAKGLNLERRRLIARKCSKRRYHSEKGKEYNKKYRKEHKEDRKKYDKEYHKKYYKEYKEDRNRYSKEYYKEHKEDRNRYSKEYRENHKKYCKEYFNRLCLYNGETITLSALARRFRKACIQHSTLEAKQYLMK